MEFNLIDMDDGVPLWQPPPPQPATSTPMGATLPILPSSQEAARRVRLPDFWSGAPRQWFATAEAQFRTYGVSDSTHKFNLVVASLPEQAAKNCTHLLEHPPQFFPYEELRHHLTAHHDLTNYEKVERLVSSESLGGRKPSEMLAAMLELCPRGEEKSAFLAYFFLQRLPVEVRILLAEDDQTDLRQLAARADKLVAHNNTTGPNFVAAVKPAQQQHNSNAGRRGGRGRGRGGNNSGGHQPVGSNMAPGQVAQTAVGLCWYHWKFGDKAQKCDSPCTWEGN